MIGTSNSFVMTLVLAIVLASSVIVVHAQSPDDDDDTATTSSCRLLTYVPFSDLREGPDEPHRNTEGQYGYGNWRNAAECADTARSLLAAAEMARRDFNTRNARLVPDLTALTHSCTVQLTDDVTYLDSAYHRDTTVRQFLEQQQDTAKAPLCAVVGPVDYQSHAGLASLTETAGIPQVAYATLDHKLSRTDYFPNFVRLVPTGTSMGETLPLALFGNVPGLHWERPYIANIYEPDYGEQFENPIEDAEDTWPGQYHTLTESYTPGNEESLREALSYVTNDGDGYRTVLLTIDQWAMMDDIARVAVDLNITGRTHLWAVTGDAIPPAQLEALELEPGHPLDVLLDGMAVFTHGDLFLYNKKDTSSSMNQDDAFVQAWHTMTLADVQNVWQRQPGNADTTNGVWSDDYFQTHNPAPYTSFIYDAVMAVGLSKCREQQQKQQQNEEQSPATLVDLIKRLQFTGASGPISFLLDDDGNPGPDRDPAGVMYGWHNIRPKAVQANGKRKYEMVLVATYETIDNEGRWISTGEPFYFYGNTTHEPMPYIAPNKFNYLSGGIQTLGFVLVAVALAVSIGSALWLFIHREDRLVKASQPEFLIIMCMGAALVATSLVFISFDEDKGWDATKLSRACASFPWFFILGYEMQYCALVCKLWRLSKLLQMRRRAVAVKQVLLPFGIVTLGILALLTAWTVHDPLQWERDNESADPRNTYGRCEMENNMAMYLAPLGALVLVAMCATAYLCWTLRDVQPDLAESRWIFLGIFGHLQIWAIGIPLLVIAEEISRDVSYIMSASLCFVFATTMVCSVVWPKMFIVYRDKYFGGDQSVKIRVNTSGQAAMHVSGLNFPTPSHNTGSGNSYTKPEVRQSTFLGGHSSDMSPVPEESLLEAQIDRAPAVPDDALDPSDT